MFTLLVGIIIGVVFRDFWLSLYRLVYQKLMRFSEKDAARDSRDYYRSYEERR